MTDTNEATSVISFGIFTLLATLAGLHYRDSLCCLPCCVLFNAWNHRTLDAAHDWLLLINSADGVEDIEATAGMIDRRSTGLSLETDHTFVEMQPHTTLPLYFDSSMTSPAVPVGARNGL
jgi:hypothetical protein